MSNNFNVLRIFFASVVVLFHIGVLTNNYYLSFFPGELAVHCFFVISGYLITKSYFNNNDLKSYCKARFLRIYPLYFIVVIVSFLIGLIITNVNYNEYLNSGGVKYLLSNLFFLNFLSPSLPGVFVDNNITAVNGSLWTIKVEVMFYILVPIIYGFFIREKSRKIVTILIGGLSVFFYYIMYFLIDNLNIPSSLNNQLPSFLSFFMVGAYINFLKVKFNWLLYLSPIIILCSLFVDSMFLQPIITGGLVYILAFLLPKIKLSNKIGDISYGLYIWHFPVIQFYIFMGLYKNPIFGIICTLITVIFLSYISWHCIEKRFLYHRSYNVKYLN